MTIDKITLQVAWEFTSRQATFRHLLQIRRRRPVDLFYPHALLLQLSNFRKKMARRKALPVSPGENLLPHLRPNRGP